MMAEFLKVDPSAGTAVSATEEQSAQALSALDTP